MRRTSSIGRPTVSWMSHSTRWRARTVGQASPQPIVTTYSHSRAGSASSPLERWPERSSPSSLIASIATGCTRPLGCEPALQISHWSPAIDLATASAIWERQELATQTNTMLGMADTLRNSRTPGNAALQPHHADKQEDGGQQVPYLSRVDQRVAEIDEGEGGWHDADERGQR